MNRDWEPEGAGCYKPYAFIYSVTDLEIGGREITIRFEINVVTSNSKLNI